MGSLGSCVGKFPAESNVSIPRVKGYRKIGAATKHQNNILSGIGVKSARIKSIFKTVKNLPKAAVAEGAHVTLGSTTS
jgi:hypothetical protein